jgi:hypothetical protein
VWSLQGASCADLGDGGRGLLVLRPEALLLLDEPQSGLNTLRAVLRSAAYEGDAIFLEAEAEEGVALKVRVPMAMSARIPPPGGSLLLGWRPEASIVVPEAAA